ncbi:MAG: restriction endonuclease [Candidatus Pacebacteria bacterium]|nr:restriction endonuclease [Methanobacteriaceae archaeon]MDD4661905.1 restriction endonuclease [Candidatus Paceibacterota bacterium]
MIDIDFGKIFLDSLKTIPWTIYLLLLLPIFVKLALLFLERFFCNLKKKNNLKKYQNWGTEQDILLRLKSLHPKEFEEFITFLFSKLGYQSEAVGASHDGGIDVVVKKDGKISYIQCKKYISSQVSVSALRDFYGAIANKLTDTKSFFITTNSFTLEAEKFAEDKLIELIDGFTLLKYIKMAGILKEEIPDSDSVCPRCGGNLILRKGRYGEFYGCSNYPICKYIKKIKKERY